LVREHNAFVPILSKKEPLKTVKVVAVRWHRRASLAAK
jgi:hypothetical protein